MTHCSESAGPYGGVCASKWASGCFVGEMSLRVHLQSVDGVLFVLKRLLLHLHATIELEMPYFS